MREVSAETLQKTIKELFLEANYVIGRDIYCKLEEAYKTEVSEVGRSIIKQLIENYNIAAKEKIAICQDTGMAIVFVELGQDVRIIDGDFNDAINQGVREAYIEGYLRKSVVDDPVFERKNTNDNTPAIIHVNIIPGDKVNIMVTAKGFGSENMSAMKILKPGEGSEGVKNFIVDTAVKAGPNPCPPIIVGVGVGGTIEKSAYLAKKATLRAIGKNNLDERYANLEKEALYEINKSGNGPGGLGGRNTALAVNIDYYPAHITGMIVTVNICCHAARHAERTI